MALYLANTPAQYAMVRNPAPLNVAMSAATYHCRVYMVSVPGFYNNFFSRQDGTGGGELLSMRGIQSGAGWKPEFALVTSGGGTTVTSPSVVATGVWTTLTAVFDNAAGTKLKLYVNGVSVVTANPTGTTSVTTRDLCIWGNVNESLNNAEERPNGYIQDIRIYNRALSQAEVETIAAGPDNIRNGLVMGYPMISGPSYLSGYLQGDYYTGTDFSVQKGPWLDPIISFADFEAQLLARCGQSDYASVRWRGQVRADYTETYTFYTNTDDGVRLYVNGTLLVDKWFGQPATEWSGTIALTAGVWYDVIYEYFENTSMSVAEFKYSSASETKKIVPATALRAPIILSSVDATDNALIFGAPTYVAGPASVTPAAVFI